MKTVTTKEGIDDIFIAMDAYKSIAQELIDKLITETDQPEKIAIKEGYYYEIQGADILNEKEMLSGNWNFFVHGEHCMFQNATSGQTVEVSLGNKESVGNLDPYFFYNFLETTLNFQHLTKYFKDSFSDVLSFFQELTRRNLMIHVYGHEFRKL